MSRALLLVLLALIALPGASTGTSAACPSDAQLGTLAYARGGALHLLDLGSCRDRVLVPRGAASAQFSGDGRYVAFGHKVASVATGRVFSGPWVGTWAPQGHQMAAITRGGGVVTGGPGVATRHLIPDGFGASSLAWWKRSLVVSRYRPSEIWIVSPSGRRSQEAGRLGAYHNAQLAGVSNGWIFWWPFYDQAISANLDGRPLLAKRIAAGVGPERFARSVLTSADFIAWCGRRVVVAAGADRFTTHGKRLVEFIASRSEPAWRRIDVSRDQTKSWVSPACSPDHKRIAVSAGRNWVETRFGRESRGIWVLSADGRDRVQLTTPPPRFSDELPRWSADGRSVLFIRSGPTASNATAPGALYLARLDGSLVGPIVELGRTTNYYGHYYWAGRVDWHR